MQYDLVTPRTNKEQYQLGLCKLNSLIICVFITIITIDLSYGFESEMECYIGFVNATFIKELYFYRDFT